MDTSTSVSRKRPLAHQGLLEGCHIESASTEKKRQEQLEERNQELAGPTLGNGPVWRLGAAKFDASKKQDESVHRCRKMLEQALSCSELAEVRFLFDDGKSLLHGHWAMLFEVCQVFRQMKEKGMLEMKRGEVRVVGISRESFRGFLEWLYIGMPGPEMAGADGREVWLLAERYQVDGIKEWLMADGLCEEGVCAAVQYSLEGDGERRDDLLKACQLKCGYFRIDEIGEGSLHGVNACVVREVLEAHSLVGYGSFMRGMDRYKLVERWVSANGCARQVVCDGEGKAEMDGLMEAVNLCDLPSGFLRDVVMASGLVGAEVVADVLEKREAEEQMRIIQRSIYEVEKICDLSSFTCGDNFCMAVSRDLAGQRVAIFPDHGSCVHILDIDTSECVAQVLLKSSGPYKFSQVQGMAFNKRGELIVSTVFADCIQVFDREGVYVRSFGRRGVGNGEFNVPTGIAVNNEGDIFVCDPENRRVQVFREDGTFKFKFGWPDKGFEELEFPHHVAVGLDGCIVLGSAQCVRVFDPCGGYLLKVGREDVDDELDTERRHVHDVTDVAFGVRGEILVFSIPLGLGLELYSPEGGYLCSAQLKQSGWWYNGLYRIHSAVDQQGRIFVRQHDSRIYNGVARIAVFAQVKAEDRIRPNEEVE